VGSVEVTDEELTAEALAADPDCPLGEDAVAFESGDGGGLSMLPEWYMPAPSPRRSRGRVIVFTVLAGSLVAGNVVGFCVTFGFPEFVLG
jgi:hypothetical protein